MPTPEPKIIKPTPENLDEAKLKQGLCDDLRKHPKMLVFRHEDRFTHGIPDISCTGNGRTIWLEVKFGDPGFTSRGIQEATMKTLAQFGLARYIVYLRTPTEERTYIVPPRMIDLDPRMWKHSCSGFDHNFVTRFVQAQLL